MTKKMLDEDRFPAPLDQDRDLPSFLLPYLAMEDDDLEDPQAYAAHLEQRAYYDHLRRLATGIPEREVITGGPGLLEAMKVNAGVDDGLSDQTRTAG